MERTFDDTNEIFSNLDPEVYELTKKAAEMFYTYGQKYLMPAACKLSGLTETEILNWW